MARTASQTRPKHISSRKEQQKGEDSAGSIAIMYNDNNNHSNTDNFITDERQDVDDVVQRARRVVAKRRVSSPDSSSEGLKNSAGDHAPQAAPSSFVTSSSDYSSTMDVTKMADNHGGKISIEEARKRERTARREKRRAAKGKKPCSSKKEKATSKSNQKVDRNSSRLHTITGTSEQYPNDEPRSKELSQLEEDNPSSNAHLHQTASTSAQNRQMEERRKYRMQRLRDGDKKPVRGASSVSIRSRNRRGTAEEEYNEEFFSPPPPSSIGVDPGKVERAKSPERDGSAEQRAEPPKANDTEKALDELHRYENDETLVRVTILSSVGESSFFVLPTSLIVSREKEMRHAARAFGIGPDRWSGSLLGRKLRERLIQEEMEKLHRKLDEISGVNTRCEEPSSLMKVATQCGGATNGPFGSRMAGCTDEEAVRLGSQVCLTLDPELECAVSGHQRLIWDPILTSCIRSFYNTGTIRVPDQCAGNDVLLALEYFGIVYAPDQLVFDSFGCYLRVKLWSDYYTHRAAMADWVVRKLMAIHSRHSHAFVTSPDPTNEAMYVGSKKCGIFDGGLVLDAAAYEAEGGHVPHSCTVVHEFFNDDDEVAVPSSASTIASGSSVDDNQIDRLIRKDFSAYLQNALPGTTVTFSLKKVTTNPASKFTTVIGTRAYLHIDFNMGGKKKKDKSESRIQSTVVVNHDSKDCETVVSALETVGEDGESAMPKKSEIPKTDTFSLDGVQELDEEEDQSDDEDTQLDTKADPNVPLKLVKIRSRSFSDEFTDASPLTSIFNENNEKKSEPFPAMSPEENDEKQKDEKENDTSLPVTLEQNDEKKNDTSLPVTLEQNDGTKTDNSPAATPEKNDDRDKGSPSLEAPTQGQEMSANPQSGSPLSNSNAPPNSSKETSKSDQQSNWIINEDQSALQTLGLSDAFNFSLEAKKGDAVNGPNMSRVHGEDEEKEGIGALFNYLTKAVSGFLAVEEQNCENNTSFNSAEDFSWGAKRTSSSCDPAHASSPQSSPSCRGSDSEGNLTQPTDQQKADGLMSLLNFLPNKDQNSAVGLDQQEEKTRGADTGVDSLDVVTAEWLKNVFTSSPYCHIAESMNCWGACEGLAKHTDHVLDVSFEQPTVHLNAMKEDDEDNSLAASTSRVQTSQESVGLFCTDRQTPSGSKGEISNAIQTSPPTNNVSNSKIVAPVQNEKYIGKSDSLLGDEYGVDLRPRRTRAQRPPSPNPGTPPRHPLTQNSGEPPSTQNPDPPPSTQNPASLPPTQNPATLPPTQNYVAPPSTQNPGTPPRHPSPHSPPHSPPRRGRFKGMFSMKKSNRAEI